MKINQFRINKHGGMNNAKPLAIYELAIGIFLLCLWSFYLLSGNIPEYNNRPTEFSFHLAIEACTALMLIISSLRVLLTKGHGEGMLLMSTGMLFYALLNNSGYYAERANTAFILMFILMLAIAIYLTYLAFHGTCK
jgi:hypothetical protein